ncbi:MAG: AsmA family protein [Pseudomonadota bacterium]
MRWIFRLVGLVIVIIVTLIVALFLLPGEKIAGIAADQISSITGRQVTMTGDTTISFFPVLGISTGEVTVANAEWAGDTPMFRADSLKIGVEPQALFGGAIRITGFEAIGPKINLRRDAQGRVNWELGVENVAPSGQSEDGVTATSSRLALTLDRALIKDASFSFIDDLNGTVTQQSGVQFDLRWPDYEGAADFDITLQPEGGQVDISGQLDRVGHFIDGGISDVTATIKSSAGTIGFTGRAGAEPQAEGRLTVDLANTNDFLGLFGLGPVDVPAGLGRSASISTDITVTPGIKIALRDTSIQLDGNRFAGGVDADLSGDKPKLNVQLNAGALNLKGLSAGSNETASGSSGASQSGGSQTSGASSSGWSKAPINASGLGAVDGEFALVAESIDLGDFKLAKTRSLAKLEDSRLVFTLREVRAYDGLITGEFVLNNRSGLSIGGNMNAESLNLQTFLADAIDVSRFSGSAQGNVSFLGVGQSLHAIMNSLSGKGGFSTGRGVISGFDLDRLMRRGDGSGGTTVFDNMNATFTMDKGNLYNSDLSMVLPQASAVGEGRIGLGPQDIDYLFTPRLLDGGSRDGLAIPVRIRGPWSNPRIVPDLEKALEANFEEEKKKLERKAQQEVQRALGIEQEEGQSLEDAAEDALKKELGKGLKKLFD